MKSVKEINLPIDYALVMQQLIEDGEDDVNTLSDTLNIHRSRVMHILTNLLNRGLVIMKKTVSGEIEVKLSRKGMHVFKQIWPEYFAFM